MLYRAISLVSTLILIGWGWYLAAASPRVPRPNTGDTIELSNHGEKFFVSTLDLGIIVTFLLLSFIFIIISVGRSKR